MHFSLVLCVVSDKGMRNLEFTGENLDVDPESLEKQSLNVQGVARLADEYGLTYSWAKKLCKRLLGENGERKPRSGRPRKTSIREDRF